MTGYRIFYSTETDRDSVDVGASATNHTITIPQPQSRLTYSISIVTLSSQLPSTQSESITVTVGKQKSTRFLFYAGILYVTCALILIRNYQTWAVKRENQQLRFIPFHYVIISVVMFLISWHIVEKA